MKNLKEIIWIVYFCRLLRRIKFQPFVGYHELIIFTAHDVSLMDCKKLFRKEQIWFVHKDEEGVYLYSLADFTAKDGVRDTTDIIEKYNRGVLGAIPDPDMIETLLQVKNDK